MKSILGGSAVLGAALLTSSFIFSAKPSVAETQGPVPQQQNQTSPSKSETKSDGIAAPEVAAKTTTAAPNSGVVMEATDTAGGLAGIAPVNSSVAPVHYTATAYSLPGRTASGKRVSKGLIAADPRVLPLGTRVRLDAGQYSGEYLVADTGGAVKGKRIDIWTPTSREAMSFGRRKVKLTVLTYGPKRTSPRKLRSN